ncbi:thioredoxin-like protein [Cladochytrium replicatum]|nr:thioredoxin-like protein [Cladochytrium replicatum]
MPTFVSSKTEYDRHISGSKPVVIDFFAEWCGPCKMVAPRYESLSQRFPGVTFLKVDVDKSPDIAQKEGVTAMPTFVFYSGGKHVESVRGADINKVERVVTQLAAGGTGGFPQNGGRRLGDGNDAPSGSAPGLPQVNVNQNTMIYIAVVLFVVYLYLNRDNPSHIGGK